MIESEGYVCPQCGQEVDPQDHCYEWLNDYICGDCYKKLVMEEYSPYEIATRFGTSRKKSITLREENEDHAARLFGAKCIFDA